MTNAGGLPQNDPGYWNRIYNPNLELGKFITITFYGCEISTFDILTIWFRIILLIPPDKIVLTRST